MLWVEVLNRALDWQDLDVARKEQQQRGTVRGFTPLEHAAVLRDVRLLRWAFARLSLKVDFPGNVDQELSQWLAAVTLRAENGRRWGARWPDLRGSRRQGLQEPFESLLSTALVQLMSQGQAAREGRVLQRCEGVLRDTNPTQDAVWPHDEDFARRASIVALVQSGEYRQCPRVIVSSRGGRFCSKMCSNASFAARKASAEPHYFAEKQQRYRTRQQTATPKPRNRGAFVYMD